MSACDVKVDVSLLMSKLMPQEMVADPVRVNRNTIGTK